MINNWWLDTDDIDWWHWLITLFDDSDWWQWLLTLTDDNDWLASTIVFCFDAKDEIHSSYAKLAYRFYYASLMVVWLLDYWKLAQTQSNTIFRLL